ncbi:MAG: ribonuclease R [Pseudomonadota bacterium]
MARQKKNKKATDPYADREAKKYANPIASREYILDQLEKHTGPATFTKLKKLLGLKKEHDLVSLERRLRAMERDGQIVRNRQGSFLPVGHADLVRGRIIAHPDGFGFLSPDESDEKDIFLSPREMRATLHGDRAVVRITHIKRDGRKEGHLVEVVERQNETVVGRYHEERGLGYVIPDNKRITQDIFIPPTGRHDAKQGQIVTAKIIEQPTRRNQPIGEIIEILGEHMAPGMEIDIAIRVHALPNVFPEETIEEAKSFSEDSIIEESSHREDLQHLPFVTIDGEDAKDFDDAVYCEPINDGWKLYVAIADVSFYVQPGSELDKEAHWRGTSVYFPGRVIPMLPESLSNGLCSLNPDIPRLSLVCEMRITSKGRLRSYKFYKAVFKSHARLTYTEVAAGIVDKKVQARKKLGELCTPLDNLYSLFKALLSDRVGRGAIDFHTTETKIEFGPNQKITRIYPYHRNDAHRIIEECMITANVAAARYLSKNKFPGLYRIHEGPSDTKLKELRQLLKPLGLSLAGGEKPEPKHYANLINQINQRQEDRWIETMLLRSLSQAIYSPDNVGHFGLSHPLYAHFTSPIRRYPDLIVHRAISHLTKKQKADTFFYTHNEMVLHGEHCSMTERRADDATRDAEMWLKCEFMQDKIGQVFPGEITSVTSFGLFVELTDVFVEGLVHISTLSDDYYHFEPATMTLEGELTHQTYRLGDKVKILVSRVDIDERKIDFILQETKKTKRTSKKKSKSGKKTSSVRKRKSSRK